MADETIDDFLSHRTSEASGGKYLSDWKKRKKITTWLHTGIKPKVLWRHGGIPRVVSRENRNTGEQEVQLWGGQWVCHEREDVLKKQYKYNDDGSRTVPPKVCPLCKLIAHVHAMVQSGDLSWTDTIFQFDADDSSKSVTIHAGGLYNAFGRDLDDQQKLELKRAGISPRESWKETAMAKANYMFCVVDHENPDNGVQIATVTSLLGDKIKDVIVDARESLGREKGDPFLNPFAIQWVYKEEEAEFSKKYHARRMDGLKLTPEIAELLRGEPPDIARDLKPFNPTVMRTLLEQHSRVDFPWDDIFSGVSMKNAPSEEEAPRAKPAAKKTQAKAPPPPADDDDMVACDECEAPMRETDPECAKCGHKYDVPQAAPPPPPPPPLRKRGAAAAKPAAPAPKGQQSLADDDIESDGLPF